MKEYKMRHALKIKNTGTCTEKKTEMQTPG